MSEQYTRRRSYARETVRWRTAVTAPLGSFNSWVCDVSAIGAFVSLDAGLRDPEVGQEVVLDMTLPVDQQRLSARGVVRWVGASREHRCRGFGVSFAAAEPQIAVLLDDVGPLPS